MGSQKDFPYRHCGWLTGPAFAPARQPIHPSLDTKQGIRTTLLPC